MQQYNTNLLPQDKQGKLKERVNVHPFCIDINIHIWKKAIISSTVRANIWKKAIISSTGRANAIAENSEISERQS